MVGASLVQPSSLRPSGRSAAGVRRIRRHGGPQGHRAECRSRKQKLIDLGFESRLRNEPSDFDLSRCKVASQSKQGGAPPGATVALALACEEAPPPPEPLPPEAPAPEEPAPAGNCDPNYEPCVAPFPPDVDCADVDGPVTVTGDDPHALDADTTARLASEPSSQEPRGGAAPGWLGQGLRLP